MRDCLVNIDFFGEMKIETQNGALTAADIGSAKICKLFAYLILNRKSVISADILSAIIWPQGVENPYGSLRGLVFRAKKLLGTIFPDNDFITAKNGSYAINARYELSVDAEILNERLNLIQSDKNDGCGEDLKFLDGHCQPFFDTLSADVWGLAVSTYYNAKMLEYLTAVLEKMFSEKKYETVIEYATKGLAIDPLAEQLHAVIIKSLLFLGNRKLAIDRFNNTVKMFENEYNIEPTDSFTSLRALITNPDNQEVLYV